MQLLLQMQGEGQVFLPQGMKSSVVRPHYQHYLCCCTLLFFGNDLVYGLLIAAFVAGSNAVSNKNKQKQAAAEKAARLQAAEAVAASEAEVK